MESTATIPTPTETATYTGPMRRVEVEEGYEEIEALTESFLDHAVIHVLTHRSTIFQNGIIYPFLYTGNL